MAAQQSSNIRSQLICAWCVVPFVLSFFAGLVIARFLMPVAPGLSADEIATLYQTHTNTIRIGILICFAGCVPFILWGGALIGQSRRIEGASPTLAYTQIASLAIAVMIVLVPAIFFFVAAYRPERFPEITQMLNDLGWTMFVVSFPPFMAWPIALAIGIFGDEAERPVFPRWAAYFNIYVSLIYLPPSLLIFFKAGPFAWNGLFSWYIPVADFFIWAIVMTVLTVTAIKRQAAGSGEILNAPASIAPPVAGQVTAGASPP